MAKNLEQILNGKRDSIAKEIEKLNLELKKIDEDLKNYKANKSVIDSLLTLADEDKPKRKYTKKNNPGLG